MYQCEKLTGPPDNWQDISSRYIPPETIKCSCGYDTGLAVAGFLMVIPPEGLKCPKCGNIIIRGNSFSL